MRINKCDVCSKEGTESELYTLEKDYQTDRVKDICHPCLHKLNDKVALAKEQSFKRVCDEAKDYLNAMERSINEPTLDKTR